MKFARLLVAVGMMTIAMPARSQSTDCVCPKVEQTVFRVCVDQTRTLAQLVADGKYDWVNQNITKFQFALGTERVSTDIVLLHFGRSVTSEQVRAEMERLGLRPADVRELLSLGAQEPNLQRDFSIIALGAVAEVSDDRSVAYLYRGGHVRFLNLYWFGLGWFEYFRFAAVHK
ncbi:MAG: hypothetical protein AAB910_02025 [Patescibacteria group bacterium]